MDWKLIIISSPIIKSICSHLSYVEINRLRLALCVNTLKFSIQIDDVSTGSTIIIKQIDELSCRMLYIISEWGLRDFWFGLRCVENEKHSIMLFLIMI